jgi:hypothetical protein
MEIISLVGFGKAQGFAFKPFNQKVMVWTLPFSNGF